MYSLVLITIISFPQILYEIYENYGLKCALYNLPLTLNIAIFFIYMAYTAFLCDKIIFSTSILIQTHMEQTKKKHLNILKSIRRKNISSFGRNVLFFILKYKIFKFRRSHTILFIMLKHLNEKHIKNYIFYLFITNILMNIFFVINALENMQFYSCCFVFFHSLTIVLFCSQIVSLSRQLYGMSPILYSSSQLFYSISYLNRTQNICFQLNLLQFIESLSVKQRFAFTCGSIARLTPKTILQVMFKINEKKWWEIK